MTGGTERGVGPSTIRVVFFGDSICYGQLVPPHLTWVSRISAGLHGLARTLGPDTRVILSNASINGNTTRQALERMPYDVQSHGVDICVVQFGLNDANHWLSDRGMPRVSPAAFAANLREIADRARNFGARRVVMNTNHPTTRDTEEMEGADVTFESQNRRYNDIIRQVVSECPSWIALHDVEADWRAYLKKTGTPLHRLLLEDGLHLSEAGHDLYFDITWPRIETLIAQEFGRSSESRS